MGIADRIDAALDAASGLLGTATPPEPPTPTPLPSAPPWPEWDGSASDSAYEASADLDRQRTQLHAAQRAAATILTQAREIPVQARLGMSSVRRRWEGDKATLGPLAGTAAGDAALLAAGRTRIEESNALIRQTVADLNAAAGRLDAITAELPPVPPRSAVSDAEGRPDDDDRIVKAAGYTTDGDEVPEGPAAPLPDPSATRYDGPPPAGAAGGTGYWAVDTSRPVKTGTPLPAPAPYRSAPPPCSNLEGATSGVLTVSGASPQKDDALGFDLENTYKFRISGTEFGGQTQMVQIDGQWYQAQWQSYTYEMNKIPVVTGSGQIPSMQLPVMSQADEWNPVSLTQIMHENAKYSGGTFYLPNAFGDRLEVVDGALQLKTPVVPVMTRGG